MYVIALVVAFRKHSVLLQNVLVGYSNGVTVFLNMTWYTIGKKTTKGSVLIVINLTLQDTMLTPQVIIINVVSLHHSSVNIEWHGYTYLHFCNTPAK